MNQLNKKIIFPIIIIGIIIVGLLFNHYLTVNILSRIVLMIVIIIIFFDKKYRLDNIPHIPNWFFFIGIILIPVFTALQYAKIILNNKTLIVIFTMCIDLIIYLSVFYTFKNSIKLYPAKKKILIALQVCIYIIILIISSLILK